jgi:undecaprenyl-diphosphatase
MPPTRTVVERHHPHHLRFAGRDGSANRAPERPSDPLATDDGRAPAVPAERRFLEPHPDGPAEHLAERTNARPTVIAATMWLTGLVLFTAALSGVGVLLGKGPAGSWESRFEAWTVTQRRGWLSTALTPGTWFGSTGIVIGIAALVGLVLLLRRRIREFGLILLALTLEASVFGVTQFLVKRDRPSIPKLEQVAPTASFPSGHTAAAIALYVSIAIVVSDRVRHRALRTLAWVWAVVAPAYCIVSRLYRGAHHPTDVMASVVLGLASAAFAVWAVRTAVAADRRRRGVTGAEPVR